MLDEAVLHRIIGGEREIHLRQLDHLLEVTRTMPSVTVQVVPFDEAFNPGMLPAFTVLQFDRDPEIAYVEGVTGDRYEEGNDAARLTLLHTDLRAAALSPARSIALIEHVRSATAG